MLTIIFAAFGAAVFAGAVTAALGIGIAHLLTSDYDKRQNGGPDLSWYVLSVFAGIIAAACTFTYVAATT